MKPAERPQCVEDAHLEYLDELRQSGVTNMFGAAPYIKVQFEVSNDTARTILMYWMASFEERHPE